MNYEWQFDVVWENFPFLLSGVGTTVGLAILSMLAGGVLGMAIALARISRLRILRVPAYCYTELFRTTPIVVQIMWVYWVLPILGGVTLSGFHTGLVALTLNVAAFMAEIYRAGIMSINRGQTEASLALGMTSSQMGPFSVLYDGQIAKIIAQPHEASLCITGTTFQIGSDT